MPPATVNPYRSLTPRDKVRPGTKGNVTHTKRTKNADTLHMDKQRPATRDLPNKIGQVRSEVLGLMLGSLFKQGFTLRRLIKDSIGDIPPKQLADSSAKKTDFSGTFLLTTP
jgi:hypothetical protein